MGHTRVTIIHVDLHGKYLPFLPLYIKTCALVVRIMFHHVQTYEVEDDLP